MIIICHHYLPPSRRDSHVKSDYACTIIEHSPFSLHAGTFCGDIGSCTIFAVYPKCIMQLLPTPLQVISHQSVRFSKRTQKPSKNGNVTLNPLHTHQISPLLPIFCALLHRALMPMAIFTPSIHRNVGLPCA